MYQYKAKVIECYDGDTITVEIKLGFTAKITQKLRLIGIDTPELKRGSAYEKELGAIVQDIIESLLLDQEVVLETTKKGKFGRYLARVYYKNIDINQWLITNGLAREYFGKKKTSWPIWEEE